MKYFQAYELVDKKTYEERGDDSLEVFDPRALEALDNLREYFGVSIMVNNWHGGGDLQWRGYRTPEKAASLGSPNSEHRFGRAFDCTLSGISAEDARKAICANKNHPLLSLIMRLEGRVSWLHFDLKPVKNRIYVFSA